LNGPALLQLQELDSHLEQLVHRRGRLAELAARDAAAAQLAAHRAAMAADRQRADAAQATIEQCEHDGDDITKKRTRLEQQLKTVIAPREAEALMHEIATLTAKRDELDEAELVAMEELAAAEDAVATRDADTEAHVAALTTAVLDAEQRDTEASRTAAATALDAADLATYDRMRAQFKGIAIARLVGAQCMGCHLDLSRAELDAVKQFPADEVPECPQCGRLLVR
jgi:uncharacterized protein